MCVDTLHSITFHTIRIIIMKDQKLAGEFAQLGLDHFKSGRFAEAESCYSEALDLVEHKNWDLVDYHDEFAQVLLKLGKEREAKKQLEASLKNAIQLSEKITDFEVTQARYQLAEHHNQTGRYQDALDIVKPFLGKGCDSDWMLYLSAATALKALGDETGAKISALAVLTKVPGDTRYNMEEQLAEFLD